MMRGAAAALALAALGLAWSGHTAHAQFFTLGIPIPGPNPRPMSPTAPINTVRDLAMAMAACWNPPPLDPGSQSIDVVFKVSFKRSGELFGKPPFIEFVQKVSDEVRGRYYQAVAEALDRCSKMPFTDSMGGAVAGRVFRINFIDMRNRKQTLWLTTKTG
jgi:hypothetical protein